jgi:hypothetical protein
MTAGRLTPAPAFGSSGGRVHPSGGTMTSPSPGWAALDRAVALVLALAGALLPVRGAAAATLALGRQPGWPLARIEAAIASGERRIATLAAPLPVHITYLTAWVNKDGSLHFRDAVYGRDALLAEALLGAGRTD